MKSIFVDDNNLSGYASDSTKICKENVLWILRLHHFQGIHNCERMAMSRQQGLGGATS